MYAHQPRQIMGFEVIGSGATGTICRHCSRDGIFAVKFVFLTTAADSAENRQAANEVEIMQRLDSPFIVKYWGCQSTPPGADPAVLSIVLEYANAGDLQRFVEYYRIPRLLNPYRFCASIIADLIAGLLYLRSSGVVHRDIKPANILLFRAGNDYHAKIADFGLAVSQKTTRLINQAVGTLCTAAPEVLRQQYYDGAADLWSLGAVLYFMASGSFPYEGTTADEVLLAIRRGKAPLTDCFPTDFAWLVDGLLYESLSTRLTLKEIVQHDTFRRVMNERFQAETVEYLIQWSK